MDDHRLKVFCTVAKTLNFSRAAEEHFISQSAVSRIIKALEEELGVQLVHRQRGAVSLTSVGKAFYRRAREILDHCAAAVKEVDELTRTVRGVLAVGTSTTVARYVFPDLLFAFREAHPTIRVHHQVNNSRGILEALIAGDIEIGLVEDQVFYPGVLSEKLCEDELVLVAAPDHPLAGRGRIAARELRGVPFIRRERGSGTRHLVETRLREMGVNPSELNVVLTSASTDLIIRAAERGVGVACVSKWAVRDRLEGGTLRIIELSHEPLSRDFRVIRLDQDFSTHVARVFLDFLKESPPPPAP